MLRADKVASSIDHAKNSITLTVVVTETVNDDDTNVGCTTLQLILPEAMKVRVKLPPEGVWGYGQKKNTHTHTHARTHAHTHTHSYTGVLVKSLAQTGRKQARNHARNARDFKNIETQAVIKFFFSCKARCQRKFTPV